MPDTARPRAPALLVLTSFLALFLELAAIRWLNANLQVVAYFTNLVLIASFLGLGLGCLAARRRSLLPFAGPSLLLLALLVLARGQLGFDDASVEDVAWTVRKTRLRQNVNPIPFILGAFALVAAVFVPIGQTLGRLFDEVRGRGGGGRDALRAYALDIAGSLCGVLAFALISLLGVGPAGWFAVAGGLVLVLLEGRRARLAQVPFVAAAVLLVHATGGEDRWSPYYRVSTRPVWSADASGASELVAHVVDVDGLRIQDALSFGPSLDRSMFAPWRSYYRLPYHLYAPRSVLVLGAGAGNDVVVALEAGASRVVAVEIDPAIADLGRTLHPHRPYLDPRVSVVVDDARAYLARTDERFDLVVMSALDSHRQLAGMANLRLESFVYTVEAFRALRRVVAEGGAFVLNLSSTRPWMGVRVDRSLREAWGEAPRVFRSRRSPFGSEAFVVGAAPRPRADGRWPEDEVEEVPPEREPSDTPLATDDWPHLYLKDRAVPVAYLGVLAAILAASALVVGLVLPRGSRRRFDAHLFLLGCGFMLLETRSVTTLALLFGTTWYVNAIVIGAILLVILAANALVSSGRAPGIPLAYTLLAASLASAWLLPLEPLLEAPLAARVGLAALVVGTPIGFASLVFSTSFARAEDLDAGLGSNLLGVVLGGALEYSSTFLGLRALHVVAFLIYGASATALALRRRGGGD